MYGEEHFRTFTHFNVQLVPLEHVITHTCMHAPHTHTEIVEHDVPPEDQPPVQEEPHSSSIPETQEPEQDQQAHQQHSPVTYESFAGFFTGIASVVQTTVSLTPPLTIPPHASHPPPSYPHPPSSLPPFLPHTSYPPSLTPLVLPLSEQRPHEWWSRCSGDVGEENDGGAIGGRPR